MLDLTEILKNVPVGTKLYSPIYGEVEFAGLEDVEKNTYCIRCLTEDGKADGFAKDGTIDVNYPGECMLFPSKDNRDWSVFSCPCKPFDRVLVRDNDNGTWNIELFAFYAQNGYHYHCMCANYMQCIPFEGNEYLLGTSNKPIQ